MKNNKPKKNALLFMNNTLKAKKIFFVFLIFFSLNKSIAQIPQLEWAKSFSSLNYEDGHSITTDSSGNVYTVGFFAQTVDFNPGSGVFNLTSATSSTGFNVYISKLDANGNFIWAKSFTSTTNNTSRALSISIDQSQNLYIAGSFYGTTDFDPSNASFNLTSIGSSDAFVVKLNSTGDFQWAKSFGTNALDEVYSITLDNNANICLTGLFRRTVDFDPGIGVFNLTPINTNDDVFVLKLDTNGNFVWAKQVGGGGVDTPFAIATDTSNNIIVSGRFQGSSVDFDPNAGIAPLSSVGNFDMFTLKLDAQGNYLWAKAVGGSNDDVGTSNIVDTSGNIYVYGDFQATVDFDPSPSSATSLSSAGSRDMFILKFDSNGNFVWVKKIGGTADDSARVIKTDSAGNLYLAGNFTGTVDFDPNIGVTNYSSAANSLDMSITKLDNNGNLLWARAFGASALDFISGLHIDSSNNIYSCGYFQSSVDFNPSPCVTTIPWNTIMDAFVHKMSQIPVLSIVSSQTNICSGSSNGSASVSVSGGRVPYSYLWSNGATSSSISGLAAGNYSVTVTDQNCYQIVRSFTIAQSVATSPIIEN